MERPIPKFEIQRGNATLPRLSLKEKFSGIQRCKHGQVGICPFCEEEEEKKRNEEENPEEKVELKPKSTPKNASNSQIDGILTAFSSISSEDTLKALELEQKAAQDRANELGRVIQQIRLITGQKRKYVRRKVNNDKINT